LALRFLKGCKYINKTNRAAATFTQPKSSFCVFSVNEFNKKGRNLTGQTTNNYRALDNLRDIIDACAKNNSASQKLVYERYYGYALKIVFRYIYRYEKATDVVNDGFVKVFRSIGRFVTDDLEHIEQRFMGWVKKIMINVAIDELRKNSMLVEIGGIPDHVWESADNTLSPDQSL
jgi:hypothetical protein